MTTIAEKQKKAPIGAAHQNHTTVPGKIALSDADVLKDILNTVFGKQDSKIVPCFTTGKVKFVQVTVNTEVLSEKIRELELQCINKSLNYKYGMRRSGAGITVFFY